MEVTYKKSKGNAGLEGVHFQLHLVTVCLLNALHCSTDWKISTENEEAGKYDDIVVELSTRTILIQAKHKDNKKVTKELLLSHNSKNADFSLPKYFFSYEEIKSKFKRNTVIICTNTAINNKGLENVLTSHCTGHDMLDYEGCSSFFTCNEKILPDLKLNADIYYNKNLQDKGVDKAVMTDANFTDFLNHLKIFANYPCGNKMDKVIEQLLCRLSHHSLYRKISAQEIYRKVEEWFIQPHGEYLTEVRAREMFAEIKSDKYCELLNGCCVLFKCNDLKFSDPSRIYHVTTKGGHLIHVLKIYHALKDDTSKKLFVNPDEDIEVQKQSIKAFEQLRYTVLVMALNNTMEETVLNEIIVKLREILKNNQYKKVILVSENNDQLVQKVGFKDIFKLDGSVIFKHLSNDTQKRLLTNKNIVFQGCIVDLEELLETEITEIYTNSLDSEILETLIKEEEVLVGTRPLDLDKDMTTYYISRTLEKNVGKTEKRNSFSEESIFEVNQKVILIIDGAGTGKSTVLTKIADTIKKESPRLWIIRINLNDYTTILKDKKNKNIATINVVELLNSQKATELTNNLEKLVFSMNNKVVLMLDGVDEISPDYKELVLNLVTNCQQASNFKKIFVTTRPHLSQELEKNLKVGSFKILPFTEQDQVDFVTKYWTCHLQLDDNENKDRCKHYAKALVHKMSLWIKLYRNRENHFTAVPLQVRMLAEIFQENLRRKESTDWEGCKDFLDGASKQPTLPEKFNITKLYDEFIEKKRDVFLDKENPSVSAKEALIQQFNKCFVNHCSLALELMLTKKQIHLFSTCHARGKDMKECMLKIGIVQRTNDKIQFMHRTFTEYYVAASIIRELQHQNQNVEFQKFLIDNILSSVEFTAVRAFLDNTLEEIVNSLPSNIFENYQSTTYLQHFLHSTNLLFTLADEGFVAILQLILKSTNFEIVRHKKIDLPRAERNEKANTLNDLEILTQEAGVNIRNNSGHTPLHLAAIKGHLAMVKFLIEQGADLNSANNIGWTALAWAARRGRVDTVKYLLECGADIKVKHNGFTLLHLAAWCEQYDTVKLLIDEGINVNIKDGTGRTALHSAAQLGNVDIIKYLGEYGMDVNATDNCGYTALHAAATSLDKQWNCIKCLVEVGVDVNIKDRTDRTVLHYAAAEAVADTIEYLLKCGADFNVQDEKGNTAIHAAAWSGSLDCVKFLAEAGADLNIKDKSGCTVLHFASEKGNIDTVKYLLQRGVEVNVTEEHGCTPLHAATWGSYFDTVKCLVEASVDIHIKNENGSTALNFAIEKDDIRTVRYLVKCDADVNVIDKNGWTPLLLAAGNGYLDTVKCLVQAGANIHTKSKSSCSALHFAAEKGNTGIVKYLVEYGAEVNVKDNYGCTALHVAALGGYLDTIQCLVDAGADISSKNENGYTVLHFATKKGNTGAVKYLAECGIDVNIKDNRGCTALHAAAWCGYLDTVKSLVELGVDINVRSKRGNTALSLAASNNQSDTVQYLIQLGAEDLANGNHAHCSYK